MFTNVFTNSVGIFFTEPCEWSGSISELWLTNLYRPIYYETNALILNGDNDIKGEFLFLPIMQSTHTILCKDLTTPA